MQWPVVFVPALLKNRFPAAAHGGRNVWHLIPRNGIKGQARYEGSIEDERRLFYVAMTRSQKFLHLTWAPVAGKNNRYRSPSEFWDDILASKHVKRRLWEGRVQTPKTVNSFRQVDLHPSVAAMLRDFIGDRKQGFLFRTRTGTPFLQSNFLRSSLYPILEELGIEKQGFHGFRRFRVTHLESSCVPPALVKYWTGHAKSSDGEIVRQTVTDKYIKMGKDTKFRVDVAERIGLGFELPKAKTVEVVPSPRNVPNFQGTEVTVSI
jgi:UvrD-like helicase C-terminal domain